MNAHAGRLATLLGLLLAATSFSLANGPVRDALVPFDPSVHGLTYGLLIVVAIGLFAGVVGLVASMNDPVPLVTDDENHWTELVARKSRLAGITLTWIFISVIALMFAWSVVYADVSRLPVGASLNAGTVEMAVVPVIASWVGWHVERVLRWYTVGRTYVGRSKRQ